MLPQPLSYDYEDIMQSYNIPEFVKSKINISPSSIKEIALRNNTLSDMSPVIN